MNMANSGWQGMSQPVMDRGSFAEISRLVTEETGILLPESKQSLVVSRLSRRLREKKIGSFPEYCHLLRTDHTGEERQHLISLLTTNVTRFFREDHHFEAFRDLVVPKLRSKALKGEPIRIWSAACSSGEEVYSIAITLLEAFPDAARHDVRILGTDVDAKMVTAAASGCYANLDPAHVPEQIRTKYFKTDTHRTGAYTISDTVRQLVTVNSLNLLKDWPFTKKFDAIFCRNVAIYFSQDTQSVLWQRLADNLVAGGHLFIGHSERVNGSGTKQMKPVGVTLYQKS